MCSSYSRTTASVVTERNVEQWYAVGYCVQCRLTGGTYGEMENMYTNVCFLLRFVEHWHSEFQKGLQSEEIIPYAGLVMRKNIDTLDTCIILEISVLKLTYLTL